MTSQNASANPSPRSDSARTGQASSQSTTLLLEDPSPPADRVRRAFGDALRQKGDAR